ncbi:MAG: guanylyltransferase, partial [Phycisphaerales bacterium]|nr:guanylyltransferase [Phycisphaerales bacterium]
DAHRNALNAHCYWLLRKDGRAGDAATHALVGLSTAGKNQLLFDRGINFNDLPSWQKRGSGLYWEAYDKEGLNPITGQKSVTSRRRIRRNTDLPMKEAYSSFIASFLEARQEG